MDNILATKDFTKNYYRGFKNKGDVINRYFSMWLPKINNHLFQPPPLSYLIRGHRC